MDIKEIWHKVKFKDDESPNESFIEYEYENDQESQKSEARRSVFRNLINGNWLTWDFISRQRILMLLIAVLTIGYIDNRYRSEQERLKIAELQREVIDKRYLDLDVSAKLVEMSRQSHVIERLKAYNSNLKESNTPAVKITD